MLFVQYTYIFLKLWSGKLDYFVKSFTEKWSPKPCNISSYFYLTLLEKTRGAGILPSLCQGPEIVRTSVNEGKIGSC